MSAHRRGDPDLPPGPARDLVNLFGRLRHTHHVTNGQVSLRTKLSAGHISEVLTGWKAPSPTSAAAIVAALRGTEAEQRQARVLAEQLAELNKHNRARGSQPTSARTEPGVHFRLLGPVAVHHNGVQVDVGGATARAVLAALLLQGDAGAGTDELISWVWHGPGGAIRNSVYRYISSLRTALSALPGVELHAHRPRYRLVVDHDTVDWHRFRQLTRRARAARDADDAELAATLLREALGLWSGRPLADLGDRLAPFRQRMVEQRRAATEALAEIEAARGHSDAVVDLLFDEMRSEELSDGAVRERPAALLIDALNTLGRRDDAGAVYRRIHARLAEEQGIEPGTDLAAAHRRMFDGVPRVPKPTAVVGIPVPRQPISGLPRVDPHFTGRVAELRRMAATLAAHRPQALCAVHGMGGTGKTALAVKAAEAAEAAYPDGTVFLDLHGYTESHPPLTVADALDRLLRRMHIDGSVIPADLDERAAFYRHHLADRRMLIILDNARNTAQVRPLLPGDTRSAVIVTSRLRLTALDDAVSVSLDVFDHDEAVALFRAVVGDDRVRAEPGADQRISHIVESCGRLPLAIRIAAGKHRARDKQTLTSLEAQLSDAHDALDELDDDERSVAATLRVSIADLTPELVHTLALLTTHPGTDFDAYAATAIADLRLGDAARHLGLLVDRHLVVEHTPGRYRLHDLVMAFARDLVVPAGARSRSLERLVDQYLLTAEQADLLVTPHRHRISIAPLDRTTVLPAFTDYDAALEWLRAEQTNLADTCVAAGAAGLDIVCWQLAFTLRGYYFLTKDWQPWTATHEAGLAAARRLNDTHAEAIIINDLGLAHMEQGHTTEAGGYYEQARQLFAAMSDRYGENTACANLAWLAFADERYTDFLDEMRPVLAFYRNARADRNAAITLRGIGLAEAHLGRTAEAVADLRVALGEFERLELRLDSTMTWNGLGEIHQRAGDSTAAADAFTEALAAGERCGSVYERARSHHRLGELARADGNDSAAREHWSAALVDYRRLDAPQAAAVQEALSQLTG